MKIKINDIEYDVDDKYAREIEQCITIKRPMHYQEIVYPLTNEFPVYTGKIDVNKYKEDKNRMLTIMMGKLMKNLIDNDYFTLEEKLGNSKAEITIKHNNKRGEKWTKK